MHLTFQTSAMIFTRILLLGLFFLWLTILSSAVLFNKYNFATVSGPLEGHWCVVIGLNKRIDSEATLLSNWMRYGKNIMEVTNILGQQGYRMINIYPKPNNEGYYSIFLQKRTFRVNSSFSNRSKLF